MSYNKYFEKRYVPKGAIGLAIGAGALLASLGLNALTKNRTSSALTDLVPGLDRIGLNDQQKYDSLYNEISSYVGEDDLKKFLEGNPYASAYNLWNNNLNILGGTYGWNPFTFISRLNKLKRMYEENYGNNGNEDENEDVVVVNPDETEVVTQPEEPSVPSSGGGESAGPIQIDNGSIFAPPSEPDENEENEEEEDNQTETGGNGISQETLDQIQQIIDHIHNINSGGNNPAHPQYNQNQPQVTRESLLGLDRSGRRTLRRGERTRLDNGAFVQTASRKGGRHLAKAVRKEQRRERRGVNDNGIIDSFIEANNHGSHNNQHYPSRIQAYQMPFMVYKQQEQHRFGGILGKKRLIEA